MQLWVSMRRSDWSSGFSIHKSAVFILDRVASNLTFPPSDPNDGQPCFGDSVAVEMKWVDGRVLKFCQVFWLPDLPKSELGMLCKWGVVTNQEEEPIVGSCKIPAASQKQKCVFRGGHLKVAFTLCCSTHFENVLRFQLFLCFRFLFA